MVFHNYNHNGTTKQMDCTRDVLKATCDPTFNCGSNKARAIQLNVIQPLAEQTLEEALSKAEFISVLSDITSHSNKSKVLAINARHWDMDKGLIHNLLDLADLKREACGNLWPTIDSLIKKYEIDPKLIAISGDNAPVNFGGRFRNNPPSKRTSCSASQSTSKKNAPVPDNIHKKAQAELERALLGVGCPCHIANNSIQKGSEKVPIALIDALGWIYEHFKNNVSRAEDLRQLYERELRESKAEELRQAIEEAEEHLQLHEDALRFAAVDDELLSDITVKLEQVLPKDYSRTRWLSIHPALQQLIHKYGSYKRYFSAKNLNKAKNIDKIRQFFANGTTYIWLLVVDEVAQIYHTHIKKMEGDHTTLPRTVTEFNNLKRVIGNLSVGELEFSPSIEEIRVTMSRDGQVEFKQQVEAFYTRLHEYLLDWSEDDEDPSCNWMEGLEELNWIDLREVPDEEQVVSSLKNWWSKHGESIKSIELDLVQVAIELGYMMEVIEELMPVWNEGQAKKRHSKNRNYVTADMRWVQVFQHKEVRATCPLMAKIVAYIMALPPSNAIVERVFSRVNGFWTKEKSNIPFETVRAHFLIRYNLTDKCLEFIDILKQNAELRQAILSDTKYQRKVSYTRSQVQTTEHVIQESYDDSEFADGSTFADDPLINADPHSQFQLEDSIEGLDVTQQSSQEQVLPSFPIEPLGNSPSPDPVVGAGDYFDESTVKVIEPLADSTNPDPVVGVGDDSSGSILKVIEPQEEPTVTAISKRSRQPRFKAIYYQCILEDCPPDDRIFSSKEKYLDHEHICHEGGFKFQCHLEGCVTSFTFQ